MNKNIYALVYLADILEMSIILPIVYLKSINIQDLQQWNFKIITAGKMKMNG